MLIINSTLYCFKNILQYFIGLFSRFLFVHYPSESHFSSSSINFCNKYKLYALQIFLVQDFSPSLPLSLSLTLTLSPSLSHTLFCPFCEIVSVTFFTTIRGRNMAKREKLAERGGGGDKEREKIRNVSLSLSGHVHCWENSLLQSVGNNWTSMVPGKITVLIIVT